MRKTAWRIQRIGAALGLVLLGTGALQAIDPVFIYSTYLGGSQDDGGSGIAVDSRGYAYVTGSTLSQDFPTFRALQPQPGVGSSFVTTLDPAGRLVYSTYLAGNGVTVARDIALGSDGSVYVTGALFNSSNLRAFVARLDPSGQSLLYFTSFAVGTNTDGLAIAVDAEGNAYVAGIAYSPSDPGQVFVAKLNDSGSRLYSVELGGSDYDESSGIALDAYGNVYVTGSTSSHDFPVMNALQSSFGGGVWDGYVAKLDRSGALVYSTYLGGNRTEFSKAVAAAADGTVTVAGLTESTDFPTANALQPALNGLRDAFVTRLSPSGGLVYSTYIGGSGLDYAWGMTSDRSGSVYLTGVTDSDDSPFRDPAQCPARSNMTYVARLNPQGSRIVATFCLFEAGTQPMAVDLTGHLYLTGVAGSFIPPRSGRDFPVVNAFQPEHAGMNDAFVAKILMNRPPGCSVASVSPAILWPPNGKLVPIAIRGVTDPDDDPITIAITGVRQDEPLQGIPNAFGIGTSTVQLRSDRAGSGDGRVYQITFEASDGNGGVCTGTVTVCVPRDQGRGRTCGDGGGLFDSTGAV